MAHAMGLQQFETGTESKFLTKDETQEYHFLTTMLSATNRIDGQPSGTTNEYPPTNTENHTFRAVADLTELLIRNDEVIAVATADKNGKRLRGMEVQEPGPSDPGMRFPPLEISLNVPKALNVGDSTGTWLLSRTEDDTKESEWSTTNLSFGEHAATIIEMIKATHRTKPEDSDSYDKRMKKLFNYTLALSCDKVQRRIRRGTGTRNFLEYVSVTETQLRHAVDNAGVHISKPTTQLTRVQTTTVANILRAMKKRKIVLEKSGVAIWAQGLEESVERELLAESAKSLDQTIAIAKGFMGLLGMLNRNLGTYLAENLRVIRRAFSLRNTRKVGKDDPGTTYLETKQLEKTAEQEYEELDGIAEQTRWEDAAMKWLDLVTKHDLALRRLVRKQSPSAWDMHVGKCILGVIFEEVTVVSTTATGENTKPMGKFFDEFTLLPGDARWRKRHSGDDMATTKHLEEGKQQANIETWLSQQHVLPSTWKTSTTSSSSTIHPETALMSLYLTSTSNLSPLILSLSRRCCPSCTLLASFLKKTHGTDVKVAGQHSIWAPATLPPYLPRTARLAMIETARTTLQKRFQTIDESIEEEEERSRKMEEEVEDESISYLLYDEQDLAFGDEPSFLDGELCDVLRDYKATDASGRERGASLSPDDKFPDESDDDDGEWP